MCSTSIVPPAESDDQLDTEGVRVGVFLLFGLGILVLVAIGVIYWRKRRNGRKAAQYMMMEMGS